jgi:hypothetical protein
MRIKNLTEQFVLLSDAFHVNELREELGLDMRGCDSVFVKLDEDGSDYEIVYGFEEIVPGLDKELTLLFPTP